MINYDTITAEQLPALRPGQISEIERQMLYWVASEKWHGLGEIVEVGAFLGKSTSCLAAGIAAHKNPHKAKRLHVFDRWEVNDSNAFYLHWMRGLGSDYRGSFKSEFDRNTAEWSHIIKAYEGDARTVPWSGRPIEILFIDCSTSREFHEMLLRKFYRSLIPHAGTLIHQDYFLHRSYYLPPMMRKLSKYFQMIGNADTSMLFALMAPMPDDVFEEPLFASDEEMLTLLQEQMEDFGGFETTAGCTLGTMQAFYRVTHGQVDSACELAERIRHKRQPKQDNDPVLINLDSALEGAIHA